MINENKVPTGKYQSVSTDSMDPQIKLQLVLYEYAATKLNQAKP